jgi:hypothetical protein
MGTWQPPPDIDVQLKFDYNGDTKSVLTALDEALVMKGWRRTSWNVISPRTSAGMYQMEQKFLGIGVDEWGGVTHYEYEFREYPERKEK